LTDIDSGATDALTEAYDRFGPDLFGAATSLLGDPTAAEDVVRDTLVRAAAAIGEPRDPDRLRTWLFTLLCRELGNRQRGDTPGSTRAAPDDVAGAPAGLPEPDATMTRGELADLLRDAVGSLTEPDRESVALHLYAGFGPAELAALTDVEPRTAADRLRRVENRLEQAVGALLIARHGRRQCGELDLLLADWDGGFTADVRSRITRHAVACPGCLRRWTSAISYDHLSSAVWPITPNATMWAGVQSRLAASEPLPRSGGRPATGVPAEIGGPPSSGEPSSPGGLPVIRPPEADRRPESVPPPRRVPGRVLAAGAAVVTAGVVAVGLAAGPARISLTTPSVRLDSGTDVGSDAIADAVADAVAKDKVVGALGIVAPGTASASIPVGPVPVADGDAATAPATGATSPLGGAQARGAGVENARAAGGSPPRLASGTGGVTGSLGAGAGRSIGTASGTATGPATGTASGTATDDSSTDAIASDPPSIAPSASDSATSGSTVGAPLAYAAPTEGPRATTPATTSDTSVTTPVSPSHPTSTGGGTGTGTSTGTPSHTTGGTPTTTPRDHLPEPPDHVVLPSQAVAHGRGGSPPGLAR
jgi:RNA polymerase sigma factor (sigma-70 family)